jgi:hypothetical protein
VLLVAVAVLAPVAASAGTSSTSARSDCSKLRAAMGATAFGDAYATFGRCVSRYAPIEQQVTDSAQVTCTAQQTDPNFAAAHGGETFDQYYGTNADQSNAFGMCVSGTAKTASTAHTQAVVHAALTCRSQRKSDPAAFKSKYKRFSACVKALTGNS